MDRDDRANFDEAMQRMCDAFRLTCSDKLCNVYWAHLEEYPWHVVGRAMTDCLRAQARFPTIAAIREQIRNAGSVPGTLRRGTFPPDIAAQRRRHHLPVTDDEFRDYDRQTYEGGGRRLTRFERAEILRASVANTKSVVHRTAMIKRAERYERGEDVPDEDLLSAFTAAVRLKKPPDREPGEEG